MKVLIAPDSFKGGLTAKQAADAIEVGVLRAMPQAECVKVPMADGGEGTVSSLVEANHGELRHAEVTGPLGKPVKATYGLLDNGQTAVIEMAQASGLQYVDGSSIQAGQATTFGTGELMLAALDAGARRLILGLGGSATTDGGAGMAQALGVHLRNQAGEEIGFGGVALAQLDSIDMTTIDPRIAQVDLLIASDVTNPLTGPNGAAYMFGQQKGADAQLQQQIDQNLAHYADIIAQALQIDVRNIPGAGAAGGLGAGLFSFTNGQIRPGVTLVLEMTKLRQKAANVDLVFTGEGRIDEQTQFGKTPFGVALAVKQVAPTAPVVALAGSVGPTTGVIRPDGIDAVFAILPEVETLPVAIAKAAENLTRTAENITRLVIAKP